MNKIPIEVPKAAQKFINFLLDLLEKENRGILQKDENDIATLLASIDVLSEELSAKNLINSQYSIYNNLRLLREAGIIQHIEKRTYKGKKVSCYQFPINLLQRFEFTVAKAKKPHLKETENIYENTHEEKKFSRADVRRAIEKIDVDIKALQEKRKILENLFDNFSILEEV